MRAGTERLQALADRLDDGAARAPSLLPGWTRAHVVAHVARNAEALGRLVHWARTGEETPMYTSPEARDSDIERTAAVPATALAADLRRTAMALDAAFADADADGAWQATVRVRQGAEVPASLLPWFRTREVWLHAADLALEPPADALAAAPPGVLEELLDDITRTLSRDAACPSVRLGADDGGEGSAADRTSGGATWQLGDGDGPVVRGSRAALVLWLAGRSPAPAPTVSDGSALPALPRWL